MEEIYPFIPENIPTSILYSVSIQPLTPHATHFVHDLHYLIFDEASIFGWFPFKAKKFQDFCETVL